MTTITATITALPTPPTRDDPINFAARADAFLGALPSFRTEVNTLVGQINTVAAEVATNAASAVNAPGTSATSTTSLAIGTGTKSLTITTGKAYVVGQTVVIASTAGPTNQMIGVISAHNSTTGAMTVEVQAIAGTGTFASWTVALSPSLLMLSATAAQIWQGTATASVLTPAGLIAAAAFVAVGYSSTITLDLTTGFNFAIAALTGNLTLANPTSLNVGTSGVIEIKQDATGGRAVAFGSNWKFPAVGATLSSAANAIDQISYVVKSATVIRCTIVKGYAA